MLNISKEEWKFLFIIWLIVIAGVFYPIIGGFMMTPADSTYLFKPLSNALDYSFYYSQVEQAKHGIYLFKDFFTLEPQATGVFYPFWFLVGIFAEIFHLPSYIALHVISFFLIPAFIIVGYRLISFFFHDQQKRKVCLIFFVFAYGIGWFIKLIAQSLYGKIIYFPSLKSPEVFSFTLLSNSPHIIASLIALMLVFLFSFYAFENYKFRYSVLAGFCAFLLLSFHPYHLYTVVFVLMAFIIAESIMEGKLNFYHVGHYITLLIFSIPPMLYHLWAFSHIPIHYQVMLQNVTLTPKLWIVLTDYSLLLSLAAIGTLSIKQNNANRKNIFLIIWAATQFFLLYLPVNTQIRLFEGLNIPVVILATQGLFFLKEVLKNKLPHKFIAYLTSFDRITKNIFLVFLFILFFAAGNIFLIGTELYSFEEYPIYFYISKDKLEAMVWIKDNTTEQSIILSNEINGNNVPVISYRPVYIGHWGGTVHYATKKESLKYFLTRYDDRERKDFLKTNRINYLLWGPEEKALANFNPDADSFLRKVFSNSSVSIYQIR